MSSQTNCCLLAISKNKKIYQTEKRKTYHLEEIKNWQLEYDYNMSTWKAQKNSKMIKYEQAKEKWKVKNEKLSKQKKFNGLT